MLILSDSVTAFFVERAQMPAYAENRIIATNRSTKLTTFLTLSFM
jgi:hypothetical protein